MDNAKAVRVILAAALALSLGLGCATPASEQPTKAWDQSAVTTLAGELVDRVAKGFARANSQPADPNLMESYSSYLDSVRVMELSCRRLHDELKAGKGYDTTQWTYDEIATRHQVLENSPAWGLIEEFLRGSNASVAEVLTQLDAYYGKR